MQTALGVIVLDLDNFKQVNDRHGHQVGDEVLRLSGRRIKEGVRVYDLVGRYGGEEFLIVTPGCVASALHHQAERIRNSIAQPISSSAGTLHVSASIGIVGAVTLPPSSGNAGALVRAADQAMYQAKANGKNRVEHGMVEIVHVNS
jgi:diguanylate cyclase (GGDEF)-like protein